MNELPAQSVLCCHVFFFQNDLTVMLTKCRAVVCDSGTGNLVTVSVSSKQIADGFSLERRSIVCASDGVRPAVGSAHDAVE